MEETGSLNEDDNIRVPVEKKTYDIRKINSSITLQSCGQNRSNLVDFDTICSYQIGTYMVLDAINDAFIEERPFFIAVC